MIAETERAFTVQDVAREYRVTVDTVYRWIKDGRLRPMRLPGGSYRFRREHLREFDDACRDQSSIAQTTACVDAAPSGLSTGPRAASLDPFQRGREMSKPPSDGVTSGSPVVKLPRSPNNRL